MNLLSTVRETFAAVFGTSYAGANSERHQEWQPGNLSGDAAIAESWPLLTTRCRDLARNDPVFSKALAQLVALVIGEGIEIYAAASMPSDEGEEDTEVESYNHESDEWFERWAEEEADATGELSLWEMQRISFQDMAEVGNSLWLRVLKRGQDRICPLSYRLIEWEQLAHDLSVSAGASAYGIDLAQGHRISNGIELTQSDVKVAYWLYLDHPFDMNTRLTYLPTRIPAERIIHNYLPNRISSHVGVSWFAPMMGTNRDRHALIGNTLASTGLAALMSVVVKSADGKSMGFDQVDSRGRKYVKMGYPGTGKIGLNDEVEVVESKKGLFELQSFMNYISTLESMGAKLSVNRVLGDPTRANMASIRASHEDDENILAPVRKSQSKHVKRIRRDWTRLAIGRGIIRSIAPEDFNRSPYRYLAFDVVGTGRGDISQKEATEAAIDRMRSGLSDWQEENHRTGTYWRKRLRRMQAVNKETRKAGVVLDFSKGQGSAPLATSTDAEALEEANASAEPTGGAFGG